jgi:uncharacterized NAD(P)/FAD-binding protein YdhS
MTNSRENSSLPDKLLEAVAERMAVQSHLKQQLAAEARHALAKFGDRRRSANEKIAKKLHSIKKEESTENHFPLFWRWHQKRINRRLSRANQQLSETLRMLLKEHSSATEDFSKLMPLVLALTEEPAAHKDAG